MAISKDIGKLFKAKNIVILLGIVIIGFALYHYCKEKNLTQQGFAAAPPLGTSLNEMSTLVKASQSAGGNNTVPLGYPSSEPDDAAKINDITGGGQIPTVPPPNCSQEPTLNPSELLPKNNANEWGSSSPGNAPMNFLDSGYLAGINTVSGSLRNANLQLRSEPPNPTSLVSPWLNSTIEPDLMRAPFEIGCACPGKSTQ